MLWGLIAARTPPVVYAGSPSPTHKDGSSETAGFDKPHGLCVDSYGSVFVAEPTSATVRRIDSKTGVALVCVISACMHTHISSPSCHKALAFAHTHT
jgi:hypothetical protein